VCNSYHCLVLAFYAHFSDVFKIIGVLNMPYCLVLVFLAHSVVLVVLVVLVLYATAVHSIHDLFGRIPALALRKVIF
jgi:hypothetical protein